MTRLHRFPWECNACWKVFYSSERGKRSRRGSIAAETVSSLNPRTKLGETTLLQHEPTGHHL